MGLCQERRELEHLILRARCSFREAAVGAKVVGAGGVACVSRVPRGAQAHPLPAVRGGAPRELLTGAREPRVCAEAGVRPLRLFK